MSAKTTMSAETFQQLAKVCPAPTSITSDVITVVIDERHLIGKYFKEKPNGEIDKISAVKIARGVACQFYVPNFATLEKVLRIVADNPNAAIINAGWKHAPIGETFALLSKQILTDMGLDPESVTTESGMTAFARLKLHANSSTWQLLDRDEDQFTPQWAANQTFDAWRQNLDKVLPGAAKAKMLRVHSSSARVLREDGTPVGGGNGHVWIKVTDASDAERTRTAIMARALEHDLAWAKPRFSKSTGQECGRGVATIVDSSVWTIGRIVFAGCPTCSAGLTIIPQQFELIDGENETLDTSAAVISPLKTFRASARHGVPLRLSSSHAGYNSAMHDLQMDTEIELDDGSVKTVRDLTMSFTEKVRCQAPFRASSSMAAFFALDGDGNPFVFDSGTDTKHVLENLPTSKPDKKCDQLIAEVKSRLATAVGEINVEAVFNEMSLRAAWNATFFQAGKDKLSILNNNDEPIELSVPDAMKFGLKRTFGKVFYADMLDEVIAEKSLLDKDATALRKSLQWLEHGPLVEHLKLLKQAKSLDISVDMFAKHGHMSVEDNVATVALPHRRFPAETMIDPAAVTQVHADYIQHFPEFALFLSLVLHARFATDRRHAFVWLHSPSSWGKGFLLAIFMRLGLVVEISAKEIEAAMAGGPVGISLTDTLRSWILFVDEFKAASSELKLLNTQIALAPKNQLRCKVQLYTKLFASAESVRSLVGDGVEAQFNNRFAYLSPSTHDQKLEDRQLFKELGKAIYIGALVSYVAHYLNDGVDRLIAMGAVESSKVSDNFIETYQAERRLETTFGSLDDAVDDIVDEIRKCLIEYARVKIRSSLVIGTQQSDAVEGLGIRLQQTLKRKSSVGYVNEGGKRKKRHQAIVLSDPEPFIKSYLTLSDDQSTIGKLQYKTNIIAAKLHMRPESYSGKVRVYDSDGKSSAGVHIADKRGVVIFLDYARDVAASNDDAF